VGHIGGQCVDEDGEVMKKMRMRCTRFMPGASLMKGVFKIEAITIG
jgi:hypothetical protein